MPLPTAIGPDWVTFRRVQTHLLAGIEYLRRYGRDPDRMASKLPNLYLDLEYVTLAAMTGALASNDRQSQEWVRCLRSEAVVIEYPASGQESALEKD